MRLWRSGRHALLASTALSAALLAAPAGRASPAPQTTPQGGQVVGGSASISQGQGRETITQTSQRAAINWQSFNVGQNAHVSVHQPNARAILLNRVISNDPSVIAGRIDANGQLILVNRSGVVFTRTAQVNAESLVVSTAGISPKNFMAGKMDFNRPPRPGARIVNRGRITMKQAGLAAFVGPIVANHGTISATLGDVELAGASAFILNASADGHIAINVTKAVRQVDLGGRKVTALVTNDGTIVANGGRVTLTARALDGLVKQLLDVRGAIQADTADGKSGTITINGIGGDLRVAGSLLAQGKGPGDHGGTIAVDSTGTVTVARHALIDASGQAGGGVIAIGTDARRAATGPSDTTAPRAKAVTIEKDAAIHADATRSGNGGTVTLLSSSQTDQGGAISARGAGSGHGGTAEISSDGVISLSGTENVGAPSGHDGIVTLDPATLIVGTAPSRGTTAATGTSSGTITVGGTSTSPTVSYVDPTSLSSITGTLVLEAASLLSIASSPTLSASLAALTLDSHGNVSVSAPVSLAGSLEIDANGIIDIAAGLTANGIALLDVGTGAGGAVIGAPVTAGTLLAATISSGGLSKTTAGAIAADTFTSDGGTIGGNVILSNTSNSLISIGDLTATGTIDIANAAIASPLALDGTISAPSITFNAGSGLSQPQSGVLSTTLLTDAHSETGLFLNGTANTIGTLAAFTAPAGQVTITNASALTIEGLDAKNIRLDAGSGLTLHGGVTAVGTLSIGGSAVTETGSGAIDAPTLTGSVSGDAVLTNANSVDTLGAFTATDLSLNDTKALTLTGLVATSGTLAFGSTPTLTETGTGTIDAGTLASLPGHALTGNAILTNANSIDALAGFTASGTLDLADTRALAIAGTDSLGGDLTLADSLSLSGTGALDAQTLDIAGTISGLSLTGGNHVLTVQTITSTGSIYLNDASTLDVAGPVTAPSATFVANGLTIPGTISTTSMLSLASSAGIDETGTIGAATLAGTASLGAALTGNNSIDTLGGFTATDLLLNDSLALNIDGSVSATHTLAFGDTPALAETGAGTIDAGTLASLPGHAIHDASLTSANNIGVLSGFTAAGSLNLNDTSALAIAGTDSIGGTFLLTDAASLIGGGALDAGTLDIAGMIGSIGLTGPNQVQTLQNILSSGPIFLNDASALSIAGPVTAPSATFVSNGLTIPGTISTTGMLSLTSAASIDEAGAINAGMLAGSASVDAALTGSNSIDTLDAFTAGGTVDLHDTGTLTVTGPLGAQSAALTAGSIVIPGAISTSGMLSLTSSTGIDETGTIAAGTLAGSAPLGTTLTGSNSIDILSNFTVAGGTLDLQNGTHALTVTGTDSALDITLRTGDLAIDGSLQATGPSPNSTISLTSSRSISEAAAGAVDAALLTGSAANGVSLTGSNSIDTLGAFTATDLLLNDSQALNLAGLVSATNTLAFGSTPMLAETGTGMIHAGTLASLPGHAIGNANLTNANTIDTLSNFTASGNLTLDDAAPLTIAGTDSVSGTFLLTDGASLIGGGALDAATLDIAGMIGSVGLTGPNRVQTLQTITSTGPIFLNDASALDIAGPVTAPSATLAANGLTIPGTIATTGMLSLASGANIDEAGAINAGTLAGSVHNDAFLTGTNTIDTLAGFTTGCNLTLDDTAALTIGGTDSIGGTFLLTDAALLSGAGALDAGTLDIPNVIGGVSLTGSNQVLTLQTILSSTSIFLNDASSLTLAGPVTAPSATLAADGLTIPGTIATTGMLSLTSSAGIGETGGISAPTLAGSAHDNVSLGGRNTIGSIGSFNAGGAFSLNDTGTLGVAGPLDASAISLSADAIVIPGTISAANALTLASTTSGITETGTIDAGTLAGSAATDASLTGTNSINALDGFTTDGNLLLNDNAPLTIAGTDSIVGTFLLTDAASLTGAGALDAGALDIAGAIGGVSLTGANRVLTLQTITATGPVFLNDARALTIAGPVTAPSATFVADGLTVAGTIATTGMVSLASGTDINETGAINAPTLTGSAATDAMLTGTNSIDTFDAFTAGGNLALHDNAPLTIAGPVTAADASFSLPALTVSGPVTTGTLSIDSFGSIAGSGAIAAQLLEGRAAGAVSLPGANSIATIGAFAGGSTVFLHDTGSLTVTGPLTAADITLDGAGIAIPGTISTVGALSLVSSADIVEIGQVDAGLLTGTATRDARFTGTNTIATLGAFATGGAFHLDDASSLAVNGPLTAGDATLSSAGLTIPGTISAAGTIALGSSNGIGETGALRAATLTSLGTVTGSVSLGGANTIATLNDFSVAGGPLFFADNGGLRITGLVSAPSITLDPPSLAIEGTIATPGDFVLGGTGNVTETGAIDAGTLSSSGAITGPVTLDGANRIGTLGAFNDQGQAFALANDAPLTILGPVVAGAVTISARQELILDGSAGGGLFIDGQPLPKGGLITPRSGVDSVLTVSGGATQTLLQTGTFSINTGPVAAGYGLDGHHSTVFVTLLPTALVTFSNLQAPTTDMVLSPGDGNVAGQINLGYLLIVGTAAQQVRLFGQLGKLGGAAAAHNGGVQPIPQIRYTINACVIGSVNCTTIPIEVPPPTNPLDNFDIGPPKKRRLDRHVRLPNIATKDY